MPQSHIGKHYTLILSLPGSYLHQNLVLRYIQLFPTPLFDLISNVPRKFFEIVAKVHPVLNPLIVYINTIEFFSQNAVDNLFRSGSFPIR